MPGTRSMTRSKLQPSSPPDPSPASSPTTTVRLHIAPFSADLIPVYLSASSRSKATELSFHTVETFPEKAFGFVTLPVMEAAAIKKKLNGSIVKGSKVKVQDARPDRALKRKPEIDVEEDEQSEESEQKKKRKKDKKGKDEAAKGKDKVVEGYELPNDRKIKRGWTEPEVRRKKVKKGEKKQEQSKYSREPELLFRTKMPKNMLEPEEDAPDRSTDAKKKDKKDKKDKSKKKAKDVVVVHEFENTKTTTTPSFLKKKDTSTEAKTAHEYIDGKGWVDEDGNLIDETKPRKLLEEKLVEGAVTVIQKRKQHRKQKKPELLGSSVDITPEAVSTPARRRVSFEPESRQEENNDEGEQSNEPKTPHPLETLFKRRKVNGVDGNVEAQSTRSVGFSFFGQEEDQEGEEEADKVDAGLVGSSKKRGVKFGRPTNIEIPSTPYEPRQMRSGAPTPDTAAIGKRFSFSRGTHGAKDRLSEESDQELSDDPGMDDEDAMALDGAEDGDEEEAYNASDGKKESTFAKWFWDNRGENNRHWKQRRKEAMKEKRRRENKRIGRRVV